MVPAGGATQTVSLTIRDSYRLSINRAEGCERSEHTWDKLARRSSVRHLFQVHKRRSDP